MRIECGIRTLHDDGPAETFRWSGLMSQLRGHGSAADEPPIGDGLV
jgi:hypothetical protein